MQTRIPDHVHVPIRVVDWNKERGLSETQECQHCFVSFDVKTRLGLILRAMLSTRNDAISSRTLAQITGLHREQITDELEIWPESGQFLMPGVVISRTYGHTYLYRVDDFVEGECS